MDDETMIIGGDRHMAIHEDSVIVGLRFPMHPVIKNFLQVANLAFT